MFFEPEIMERIIRIGDIIKYLIIAQFFVPDIEELT